MPLTKLTPAIDQRLASLQEFYRRSQEKPRVPETHPTVTFSREFGCEAFPTAEKLKAILEQRTKETWTILDKSLMAVVEKENGLEQGILSSLGQRPLWLDEFFATFSAKWKSEKDRYQLLCQRFVSLARNGNVIIVGMGSPIVTQPLNNCFHFRLYGSEEFKIKSIARRLGISKMEAQETIDKMQKLRDKFLKEFLDREPEDLSLYHLVFNNDRNTPERMAEIIARYVLGS